MPTAYLLANFGGPRSTDEIEPFLRSLLTDPLVTGNFLFSSFHKRLFSMIAKRRAPKIAHHYTIIGGSSPIYSDTENLATQLAKQLHSPVLSFHRYLPATHDATLQQIQELATHYHFEALALFPHFTYSVTGSIIQFLNKHLPSISITWVPNFGDHPKFISLIVQHIESFLAAWQIEKEDCFFLFSVHGLPEKYIRAGDPYQKECECSYKKIIQILKPSESILCYQSKFGFGRWLTPSTKDICQTLKTNKPFVIIVPFGFVSDHIETLYEIDHLYLPILTSNQYKAFRVPSIYTSSSWVSSLVDILLHSDKLPAHKLLRSNNRS